MFELKFSKNETYFWRCLADFKLPFCRGGGMKRVRFVFLYLWSFRLPLLDLSRPLSLPSVSTTWHLVLPRCLSCRSIREPKKRKQVFFIYYSDSKGHDGGICVPFCRLWMARGVDLGTCHRLSDPFLFIFRYLPPPCSVLASLKSTILFL